jgi:drug/metabolite transporter (DMT)-like permease
LWILLLIAHLAGNTGYNIALRRAASVNKTDGLLLAAVMSTAIAVPAVVGIAICGVDLSRFSTNTIIGFIAAAALTITFHLLNAVALEHAEASVFALLYNLRVGIVSALGILFLGEPVQPLRLVGGALVFLAGFLVIGSVGVGRRGALLSVATAVVISFVTFFEKWMMGEVGYVNFVFPESIVVTAILWIVVLLRGVLRNEPIDRGALLNRAVLGLMPLRCVSAYGFTLALSLGALLSVSTYISSLSVVTTAVAGIILLKERDSLGGKIAAGCVALAGVTLIFAG